MSSKLKRSFAMIGAGGHGREVMPMARQLLGATHRIYFVETTPAQKEINGVDVISEAEFLALPGEKTYAVAIADGRVRQQIADRMQGHATPCTLTHPSMFLGDNNQLGEGLMMSPFTAISSNIRIGRFFQGNIFSYVGHDCVIGDFVTFGPNVHCNGNIHIGDYAYIGCGAIIRQGTPGQPMTIGEGAVVGMGAVVTKPVAPGATVVGNPARPVPGK